MLTGSEAAVPASHAGGIESRRFPVLGIEVDAVQIPEVIGRMVRWIEGGARGRTVAVTGMHGVTEALGDARTREALAGADMVVPDGMPLVWLGRHHGHRLPRRVNGPELMETFCKYTASRGIRHFFYGGAEGVATSLAGQLARRHPGLVVAGVFSPPFRDLAAEELPEVRKQINEARPDVVWVGLSTPKQEKWMADNRHHLHAAVLVGVGAAFDLNTGRVRRAPVWMRENGLEWLFRLAMEPRRLWRRYLLGGPRFVFNVALELMRLRSFG